MKQGASDKFGSLKKTVTNAKDAAVARFTRKNRGNENPESENTRLLSDESDDKELEMQNIKPLSVSDSSAVQSSNSQQTITPPPRQPPPPLPPPRQSTTLPSNSQQTITPPPRQPPPSNSQLSQNSNDFDDDNTDDSRRLESIQNLKINPIDTTTKTASPILPLLPPPPPQDSQRRSRSRSPQLDEIQEGGNKTIKNGQYMREIKDNRTHLFNKEMQILNSIRNFKHVHIDEPKKQFMKAVKRS
jgi:hypothetical protein